MGGKTMTIKMGIRFLLSAILLIAVGSVAVGEVPAEKASNATVTALASSVSYGTSTTVRASFTADGLTPIGAADLLLHDAVIASSELRDGVARFELPTTLPVGQHTLTAQYRGQGNVLGCHGQTMIEILRVSPVVEVLPSDKPIVVPTSGDVRVRVGGGPASATGQIALLVDGKRTVTATLNDGQAAVQLPVLAPGVHQISASFPGDDLYTAAEAVPIAVRVQVASNTVLLPEPPTASYGQQITVTAKHTADQAEVTGTTTFEVDGTTIGAADIAGGTAVFQLPADLAVGQHALKVTLPGTDTILGSSASANVTVDKANASVIAAPSAATVLKTDTTSVNITVAGNAVAPQGTVRLLVDGAEVDTGHLTDGHLQLTVPALPVGVHKVQARYDGDGNYLPVESDSHTLTSQLQPTVDFGMSAAEIGPWDSASVTISVVGSGEVPAGTVNILVDGRKVAEASLADGKATVELPGLSSGEHSVSVRYVGGGLYAAASSPAATLAVAEAPWINGCNPAARACVDLTNNTSWIQERGKIIYGPVPTTSGMPGHRTPEGMFKVHWKHKDHKSSLFNDAPMPYSIFFVGGIAFHVGSLSDPSHGCIHLSWSAGAQYWDLLKVGDKVHAFGYAPY